MSTKNTPKAQHNSNQSNNKAFEEFGSFASSNNSNTPLNSIKPSVSKLANPGSNSMLNPSSAGSIARPSSAAGSNSTAIPNSSTSNRPNSANIYASNSEDPFNSIKRIVPANSVVPMNSMSATPVMKPVSNIHVNYSGNSGVSGIKRN